MEDLILTTTMKKKDLVDEVLENARRDRKAVESIRDSLIREVSRETDDGEQISAIMISRDIAGLSEVLTKINSQLVEVAKFVSKSGERDESNDREDIFNEIEMISQDN